MKVQPIQRVIIKKELGQEDDDQLEATVLRKRLSFPTEDDSSAFKRADTCQTSLGKGKGNQPITSIPKSAGCLFIPTVEMRLSSEEIRVCCYVFSYLKDKRNQVNTCWFVLLIGMSGIGKILTSLG